MVDEGVITVDGEYLFANPGDKSGAGAGAASSSNVVLDEMMGDAWVGSSAQKGVAGTWVDGSEEPPPRGNLSRKFAADTVLDFRLMEHATET